MATVPVAFNAATNGALSHVDMVASCLVLAPEKLEVTFELTALVTVKKINRKLHVNDTMLHWFRHQKHKDHKGVVVLQLVSAQTGPSEYLINLLLPVN